MSPKYSVYVTRWEVYRIRSVEAECADAAEESGLEQFDQGAEHDHMDGGVDNVEAELKDE